MKTISRTPLLLSLFILGFIGLSFMPLKNNEEHLQRDPYYFILTAKSFNLITAKSTYFTSEVMQYKGYDACDRNLDYAYYGMVREKFQQYLEDQYKVKLDAFGREGSKKGSVDYFETEEIAKQKLADYLRRMTDLKHEVIKTDFSYDCSKLQ